MSLAPEPPRLAVRTATVQAFLALCQRDAFATLRRDPWGFLAQSLIAPLFYLFIFGRVLPEIGAAGPDYGEALLPGVLGLTLVLTALQGVALSLVIEFSFTKEIEDRLLAPIPASLVGVQKLVWAAARGIIAGLVILPLGELVLPGGLQLGDATWWTFVLLLVAGGFAGAAIGLVMGTAVPREQDQRRLRRRADAAAVHGRDVLPLAVAGLAALVPGRHAPQPADLRERGDARVVDGRSASRLGLDRARARGLDRRAGHDRRPASSSGARSTEA